METMERTDRTTAPNGRNTLPMQDCHLRDWFAGMAACAALRLPDADTPQGRQLIAERSYAVADALMVARDQDQRIEDGPANEPAPSQFGGARPFPSAVADFLAQGDAPGSSGPGMAQEQRFVSGPNGASIRVRLAVPRGMLAVRGWPEVARQYLFAEMSRRAEALWGPGRLERSGTLSYIWRLPGDEPARNGSSAHADAGGAKQQDDLLCVFEFRGRKVPVPRRPAPTGIPAATWDSAQVDLALLVAEHTANLMGSRGRFVRRGDRFLWQDAVDRTSLDSTHEPGR